MKSLMKNILLKTGLWYRIQYSHWYREYKVPGYKKQMQELTEFYNTLFKSKKPSLVFDIGSNVGDHSYIFSSLCERLVCVEPDEQNNLILHTRFGDNKQVTIIKKAVTDKVGTAIFHMEAEGSVFNTLSDKWVNTLSATNKTRFEETHKFNLDREVQTTTLGKLIEQFGIPDYIKIDVEGFEKEVVSGLPVKIPMLSFECNLPEFATESSWIINHLVQLNNNASFNYLRDEGFELKKNICATEMSAIVNSGQYRFLDIYCFN